MEFPNEDVIDALIAFSEAQPEEGSFGSRYLSNDLITSSVLALFLITLAERSGGSICGQFPPRLHVLGDRA